MIDPIEFRWHGIRITLMPDEGTVYYRQEKQYSNCPVCCRKYQGDKSMNRVVNEPYDSGELFVYLECHECGLRILLRDDFSTLPGGKKAIVW